MPFMSGFTVLKQFTRELTCGRDNHICWAKVIDHQLHGFFSRQDIVVGYLGLQLVGSEEVLANHDGDRHLFTDGEFDEF